MTAQLDITRHTESDGRTVLTLRGEVDMVTAPRLRAAVTEQVDQCQQLVLDVSGAVLFDISGLRVLLAACREAELKGRPAPVLRGVRPSLGNTLKITGFNDLFPREPAPGPSLSGARPTLQPRQLLDVVA